MMKTRKRKILHFSSGSRVVGCVRHSLPFDRSTFSASIEAWKIVSDMVYRN